MAGAGLPTAVPVGNLTGLGTGVGDALAIAIGSAGAPVLFNGALGTPSSGVATNLTGTASGLTAGDATKVANTTPGAGGLALLDDASADANLTTLAFPTNFGVGTGRVLRPILSDAPGGNFTMIAASAYFIAIPPQGRATVIKKIRGLLQNVNGATDSTGEVGIFTTPLPANSGNQTLTPTAAFTTTLTDLTAAAPQSRGNSVDFSTSHAAWTNLWLGIRLNTATAQPIFAGIPGDVLAGGVLVKTSAAAFDGSTTYAGVVPNVALISTLVAPWLQALLD